MARAWYVAITKPSGEALAEKELRKQGFQVFNPRVRLAVPMRGGRQRLVVRPYLPGYILICFDTDRDRWQSINGTRGIKRLFTCGDVPLRVQRGVVEGMIKLSPDGYAVDQKLDEIVKRLYKPGDRVKLSSGSFAGFEAEVVLTTADRVLVILEVFGRRTRATVPTASLQRIA